MSLQKSSPRPSPVPSSPLPVPVLSSESPPHVPNQTTQCFPGLILDKRENYGKHFTVQVLGLFLLNGVCLSILVCSDSPPCSLTILLFTNINQWRCISLNDFCKLFIYTCNIGGLPCYSMPYLQYKYQTLQCIKYSKVSKLNINICISLVLNVILSSINCNILDTQKHQNSI